MYFDEISPEEEARYLGYAAPPVKSNNYDAIDAYTEKHAPSFAQKRGASLLEEEEDYDDPKGALLDDASRYASSASRNTMNDDDIDKDPIMELEFLRPIRRLGADRQIVPYKAQMCADTLLFLASREGGSQIVLDAPARSALTRLLNQVDEFTQVDPHVVISTTINVSDTCRIFLEEIIPFSKYLLLMALHARFNVIISAKTKTRPVPFDDPGINLKVAPYKGRDTLKGQPFNTDACLEAAAEHVDDDKWTQVRAYMITLGKLSPKQVCELEFIEAQLEMVGSILSGETVIVRKRRKKQVK